MSGVQLKIVDADQIGPDHPAYETAQAALMIIPAFNGACRKFGSAATLGATATMLTSVALYHPDLRPMILEFLRAALVEMMPPAGRD